MRSVLLALLVLVGVAVAARKKGPETEAAPVTPAAEVSPADASAAPPAPTAPALFPSGLPVAIQKTPDGLANLSAQSCNACHYTAHDDWSDSAHAKAWRDPVFQLAVARAGSSTACYSCHLPLANQHNKLAAGYLDGDLSRPDLRANPVWDATLMSEGVTCAACHVRDGVVLGVHASSKAPHPVVVSQELQSAELCATCHQLTWPGADKPFYDTYGEWKASPYAAANVGCQDCHMPPSAGLATATGYATAASHAFSADPRRALSALVTLPAAEIQRGQPYPFRLRLQNTGAGHSLPTGSPFKTLMVETALIGADGKELCAPLRHTLGRKVEDAPPWRTLSDTRLAAGADLTLEQSFTVDQKKKAGPATLRVSLLQTERPERAVVLQEIPLSVF